MSSIKFGSRLCERCAIFTFNFRRNHFSNLSIPNYEFIDSGNFKRLEKFDGVIVSRSCPTAYWPTKRNVSFWNSSSHLEYLGTSGHNGQWIDKTTHNLLSNTKWTVEFQPNIKFHLFPSAMGQIGVFPEQNTQWSWIQKKLRKRNDKLQQSLSLIDSNKLPVINVLNGFAHTGGSTLAALSVENVQVTHLDASKSSNLTAGRNVILSNLDGSDRPVRWIVEDCMKFVTRECKRGGDNNFESSEQNDIEIQNTIDTYETTQTTQILTSKHTHSSRYDALIFDPPAFGRSGKNGIKTWKLDKDLPLLMNCVPKLLSETPLFVLFTCHDKNYPGSKLAEMLSEVMKQVNCKGKITHGEMKLSPLEGRSGMALNMGCYVRWEAIE